MIATKFCECGCRTRIPRRDSRGRPRSHVEGHTNKGRSNYWLVVERSRWPGGWRSKARKVTRRRKTCALARIGGCLGQLETHHVDGDHTNNAPKNLAKLCRGHHRLAHLGRVTMRSTKMPDFYVRGDGKRVYLPKITPRKSKAK